MVVIAWTSPRTWVAGLLSSAALNVDVRDNLNFLAKPPRCSVTRSAAKSISTLSPTAYDFDQEVDDTDNMHSTVTNNTRITFKTAGWYDVLAQWQWQANVTARRFVSLRINGVGTNLAPDDRPAVGGTGESDGSLSLLRPFLVNDYLELIVQQDSGSTLTCAAALQTHWRGLP